MKLSALFISILCLTACQALHSTDPASLTFRIPDGSTLSLNKSLNIEKNNTHVVIQHGKIVREKDKDLYDISCRFEMKAFGPRTVEPDTFNIRRMVDDLEQASSNSIWRNSTEIFLYSAHNSDIIKLDCSVWGDRADGSFPVSEIQKTLGDYFSFNFASGANR